jgi:hypothetical protein
MPRNSKKKIKDYKNRKEIRLYSSSKFSGHETNHIDYYPIFLKKCYYLEQIKILILIYSLHNYSLHNQNSKKSQSQSYKSKSTYCNKTNEVAFPLKEKTEQK